MVGPPGMVRHVMCTLPVSPRHIYRAAKRLRAWVPMSAIAWALFVGSCGSSKPRPRYPHWAGEGPVDACRGNRFDSTTQHIRGNVSLMRGRISLAAVSVLLLTGIGPVSNASDPKIQPSATASSTPKSAEDGHDEEWFNTLSSELGIPSEDAVARYAWSDEFSDALARVKGVHGDTFAWGAMNPSGEVGATVAFVGEPPAGVVDLFSEVPVPVTIEGGAPQSEKSYVDAVSSAHYAARASLKARGLSSNAVASEYDRVSGTVLVHLLGSTAKVPEVALNAIQSHAIAAVNRMPLAAAERRPAVEVVAALGGSAQNDILRGGGQMSGCTSGFTVRDLDSGLRGLLTADHCGTSQSYEGRSLNYRRSLAASRGDISFFSSSETASPTFWRSFSTYNTVTTHPMAPALGQALCKFGRTTGQSCDTVRNFGACRGPYCNLVEMYNRRADGGDSGGPWFDGARAVGIHSGGVCAVGCRDQFSYMTGQIGDYLRVNLIF